MKEVLDNSTVAALTMVENSLTGMETRLTDPAMRDVDPKCIGLLLKETAKMRGLVRHLLVQELEERLTLAKVEMEIFRGQVGSK